MPKTPAELQSAGRAWLGNLGRRFPLQRRLFLVPGICNEDAEMWNDVWSWGSLSIPNWAAYAERVTFESVEPRATFVDFGTYLQRRIGARYPAPTGGAASGTPGVGEYDLLCYSMGGLDSVSALTSSTGAMAKAFNLITYDTPFDGVPNWKLRQQFSDMTGRPDRQSQCAALAPGSPELQALRASRKALSTRVERIWCYSAGGDLAVQVPVSSSNLCADMPPATLFGGPTPAYASRLVPGASHAGDGAIYSNEYAIAMAFGNLLFGQ
jgi:hypothetical protein